MKLVTKNIQTEIHKKKNDPTYIPTLEEKEKYGYVDCDLDGSLVKNDVELPFTMGKIGSPINKSIERIQRHIHNGDDVRIFTARAEYTGQDRELMIEKINQFCEEHFGKRLPITNRKSVWSRIIYDDIAIQLEPNTGERIDGKD